MKIGLLGFGEVGRRFAADLRAADARCELGVFDLLLHQASAGEAMRGHAVIHRVDLAPDAGTLGSFDLVFSAVTADQTLAAARSIAARPLNDALFIDLNSAAPATKIECAALIAEAGGRYVEAAVMTSVPPFGIRVPMLLGGAHAPRAEQVLASMGFAARTVSTELGVASAIKLCRSVVIKGLEALVVESFTAARALGVEAQVLESLSETYPQFDWERQGDYLFSRMILHGRRRAEEMRASAAMIESTGAGGAMATAAALCQQAMADGREAGAFADPQELKPWRERADQRRGGMKQAREGRKSDLSPADGGSPASAPTGKARID
jgi:3-hydroxyisobutyrate dehydrogenase-like beta-hydroxyacid dehydrogenase